MNGIVMSGKEEDKAKRSAGAKGSEEDLRLTSTGTSRETGPTDIEDSAQDERKLILEIWGLAVRDLE